MVKINMFNTNVEDWNKVTDLIVKWTTELPTTSAFEKRFREILVPIAATIRGLMVLPVDISGIEEPVPPSLPPEVIVIEEGDSTVPEEEQGSEGDDEDGDETEPEDL